METRIVNNSQSLQEHFPEVYKEFFSKCPLVVSAPASFFWLGEHAVMYGICPAVIEKLPVRIYVGLEPIEQNKLEFGFYKCFKPYQGSFSEINHFNEFPIFLLKEFLKSHLSGYRIHALGEFSPCCGLNSSGAFSAALTAAIFLLKQKISSTLINSWKDSPLADLISQKESGFDDVFRFSWKLDSIFHNNCASGSGSISVLTDSLYPIIYFTEQRKGHSATCGNYAPLDLKGHLDLIDNIHYWAFRSDELFGFSTSGQNWPIDYGLIYSGQIKETATIIRSTFNLKEEMSQVNDYLKKYFQAVIGQDRQSLFLKIAKGEGSQEIFWDTYLNTLMTTSVLFLKSMDSIFNRGLNKSDGDEFFHHLNRYQEHLRLLNVSSPLLDDIIYYFNVALKEKGAHSFDNELAMKLTGGGRGGDLLFACPIGRLRPYLEEILSKARKSIHQDIHLDYCSWIDGFGYEGVRIDQDLSRNFCSDFVSGNVFLTKHWHNSLEPIIAYGNDDNIVFQHPGIDLLVDCPANRVCIQGQCLNSTQIHSTTTTVKILKLLLENLGQEVSNKNMPRTSYTIDRNEMQGKIIIPLKKIFKQITGGDLPLSITGEITNFRVRLDQSHLNIILVDKSSLT